MNEQLLHFLMYCLPTVFTAAVVFMFFRVYVDNEKKRLYFFKQKELKKQSLPTRLQAYERLTLLLERISPCKLVTRVSPTVQDKKNYESLLINTIEKEFEHNITQQIYVSDACWGIVKASKNATIQLIRKTCLSDKVSSADKLREVIITNHINKPTPSHTGLSYIKEEVSKIWG